MLEDFIGLLRNITAAQLTASTVQLKQNAEHEAAAHADAVAAHADAVAAHAAHTAHTAAINRLAAVMERIAVLIEAEANGP
jgi:hypothetical protein